MTRTADEVAEQFFNMPVSYQDTQSSEKQVEKLAALLREWEAELRDNGHSRKRE